MTQPTERRAKLLQAMEALAASGIDCQSCAGTCCTFVANSMQISPEEAEDISRYLATKSDGTDWVALMRGTIERFGLNRAIPGDGKRSLMRRHYTCPFFRGGATGCCLPREVKPYGCLAFNPRRPGQTEGGDCAVTPGVLPSSAGSESSSETKFPLPVAVLAALESV